MDFMRTVPAQSALHASSNDFVAEPVKRRGATLSVALPLLIFAALLCAPIASTTQTWQEIQLRYLCVTEGNVQETSPGNMDIYDPRIRAVLGSKTPQTAELFFRYLGPTKVLVPLDSGAVRTEIGLKLRAQDACNLVYVMWRILPVSEIVVSIKSNPGEQTSAQCQNRGYHNVTPQKFISIPALKIGGAHSLRAEITGTELTVNADGQLAWQGVLDSSAFKFDGPVGFRSDNGQFDAQLFAFQSTTAAVVCPKSGPE
jgi:hypothetical protein